MENVLQNLQYQRLLYVLIMFACICMYLLNMLVIQRLNTRKYQVTLLRQKNFFGGDGVLLCHPGWNAVVRSQLTETSTFWV